MPHCARALCTGPWIPEALSLPCPRPSLLTASLSPTESPPKATVPAVAGLHLGTAPLAAACASGRIMSGGWARGLVHCRARPGLRGGPELRLPDEGVIEGGHVHPAWVVLGQRLGQCEGLVQRLQGHRAGRGEAVGACALPAALSAPARPARTSPTTMTTVPSSLSRWMVRAGVVLGTTTVAGTPSFLAA